jgi:pimeloyl-ACP methyl ester carboxylesterase
MLRGCGWTHLHSFNALGHGANNSLWTPDWAAIEALVSQVKNSGYRGQDLGATLAILLYLSRPEGLGALH